MPRVTHVKSARKAIPDANIKVGDSYYWWKFRFGGKHVSKTPPRRSQLTQSDFLSQLWELEDRVSNMSPEMFPAVSDLETEIDDIKSDLESLKDETDEKLNNMPESLQQGPTGELLQERIDGLDSLISDLEGLEFSEPDELDDEEKKALKKDGKTVEDAEDERLAERLQEIINEAQGASWSF